MVLDDVANSGVDSEGPQAARAKPTVIMSKVQANPEPRTRTIDQPGLDLGCGPLQDYVGNPGSEADSRPGERDLADVVQQPGRADRLGQLRIRCFLIDRYKVPLVVRMQLVKQSPDGVVREEPTVDDGRSSRDQGKGDLMQPVGQGERR